MARKQDYQPVRVDEEDQYEKPYQWNETTEILPTHTKSFVAYLSFLLLSLSVNVLLVLENARLRTSVRDHGMTLHSRDTFDTPMPFRTHTEYWNPNVSESVLDAAWDALDTNPMAIAISNDTARRAGLAPSMRFPWDGERSVYYVKGFHDLHCLKVLRKALVLQHNGENYASSFDHLLQCLDGLRQSVICTADDTPVPTTTPTHDAAGPFRLCRDWNKLVDWATRPDRHACHKFDDYRQATNELELFAHCPRDSPYFSVMHTYFEYHGHRDAYGVDSESKTEG